jgi:hypothetical protein
MSGKSVMSFCDGIKLSLDETNSDIIEVNLEYPDYRGLNLKCRPKIVRM